MTDRSDDRPTAASGLTDDERALLEFERTWWKHAGAKAQAIRARFDTDEVSYYGRLDALIDSDEAYAHDPMLVKRLRRLKAQRLRQRAARAARS